MSARSDFEWCVDRATGLIVDAGCACHTARAGAVPHEHRALVAAAVRKLRWAQRDLSRARGEPWSQTSSEHRQLKLL
jgi:hypothetical protein